MLEARTVMAPLGAFPDDTGEYLLGDVLVTVVLMESDSSLPGADVSTENWTPATISEVQSKVQQGMDWWKQTLINSSNFYYNPALPLLNFKYDWTWALNPVETMYEPINRYSSYHELWVNDFLDQPDVDFANSLDIYKDIKAFNHFQREKHHTDWAFTIFVVNSTNDVDDFFPSNPAPAPGEVTYRGAFAFLGGQFLVVPSERPATTFAHEAGHIFYALDEYSTGHPFSYRAGYYNAQNLNGANGNPTPGFLGIQQPSIMATGSIQTTAWTNFITSDSSKATVGWRDTDGDGVMDVLDVPFSLTGTGSYNATSNQFKFKGTSSVRTLNNENTFGGQHTDLLYNDISINKIRRAEYSLDGGAWTTVAEYANTPTTANLDLTINGITAGPHTIKIRTFDQRTGASSEEYVATIKPPGEYTPPQYSSKSGAISGFAYRDDNGNGNWDNGEFPLADWGVELQTIDNTLLTLAHIVEPSDYSENTQLNTIQPGITLSVIGGTAAGSNVLARTSALGAGRIFFAGSQETFTTKRDSTGNNLAVDRQLKAEFNAPVTSVSLKAISGVLSGSSVGRLDAYDANNNLIGRYTTRALAPGQSEVMTITHNSADIKYVIASSHLETEVLFDTLVVGPQTATTTNADGGFNISALPPGTYNLKVIAAPNYIPITPLDGRASVTVSASSTASNNLYFAFQFGGNPWHNLLAPLNANGTGGITAFDALVVINYLNLHPNIVPLVASEAVPGQYLDVNNDNRCTAFDALQIINYLNVHGADIEGGGGGGGGAPEAAEAPPEESGAIKTDSTGSGNTGGSGGGESSGVPQNSVEYFATNPLHISQRFKDESHDHNHDHENEFGFVDQHHDEFAENDFAESIGSSTEEHHDHFFLLVGSLNQDDDVLAEGDAVANNTVALAISPLSSDIASLIERLRRLKVSAERDEDQPNARLAAIRAEFGDDFDVPAATIAQLSRLRELLKQNVR